MKEYSIDCRKLADREHTFEYLKKLFDLPEYCGNNLDAIYDCLTDFPEFKLNTENADKLTDWGRKTLHVLANAAKENGGMTMEEKRTKIGIVAALEPEINALKDAVKNKKTEIIAGSEYVSGEIGKYDVVFMQCGMGKVSAALGTQAMISAFAPDYIINTGCAGAISQKLAVGDIVLADSTAEWDMDIREIGFPRGFITALGKAVLETDADFTKKIESVLGRDNKIYHGMIVSGDQFISTNEQRKVILDAFPGAMCAEMEGAAIGHVCVQNNVPFCIVRCMSDNANGDSQTDYATFSAEVSEKLAGYLLGFLNA